MRIFVMLTSPVDYLHIFSSSTTVKASVILLPLLGLTWVLGLFAVNRNTLVFAWLFTIFNSLQVQWYYDSYMYIHGENAMKAYVFVGRGCLYFSSMCWEVKGYVNWCNMWICTSYFRTCVSVGAWQEVSRSHFTLQQTQPQLSSLEATGKVLLKVHATEH